jgi:tRNA threonylcarbamoyladenosine biosynthesis protein TsaE
MEAQVVLSSTTPEQTHQWGKLLGILLERGDVVALKGELGAGKTTLAQGIAEGLGVSRDYYVTSPTFTLINEYKGRIPLYHLDFYRINTSAEVEHLGLEEYFQGEGVSIIEWPEKIEPFLPSECLMILLEYVDYHVRKLSLWGRGHRYGEMVERIGKKISEGDDQY